MLLIIAEDALEIKRSLIMLNYQIHLQVSEVMPSMVVLHLKVYIYHQRLQELVIMLSKDVLHLQI